MGFLRLEWPGHPDLQEGRRIRRIQRLRYVAKRPLVRPRGEVRSSRGTMGIALMKCRHRGRQRKVLGPFLLAREL